MTEAHALEVQTLFRGVVIGTKHVTRPRARRGRTRPLFVIGSTARADAPVAAEYLAPGAGHGAARIDPSHALVTAGGDGPGNGRGHSDDRAKHPAGHDDGHYEVSLTPHMTGVLSNDDGDLVLPARPAGQDVTFTLSPGDRARIECGAVTFLLASTARPSLLAAPPIEWRSHEHRYHLATALGIAAFLLVLRALPADPRTLSLDLFARDRGLGPYLIKAAVPPPIPADPSAAKRSTDAAQPGRRAPERAGEMGRQTALDRNRRYASRGRADNPALRRAPEPVVDAADAGVLGVIRRSAAVSSIFARDSAFGRDAEDVLGSLVGDTIGQAFGRDGLGPVGTGSGGGDTGARTLDSAPGLGTFGAAGGHDEWRRGSVGSLGPHHTVAPGIWLDGHAQVRGSLDREIVRRIIRRHINEVRFCYEQALSIQAKLGGRILVKFMIASNGQVLSSVVESSTLGNARVEGCTAQAVRRWEFPRPEGGGLVMVTYPFVLTPAGSAP